MVCNIHTNAGILNVLDPDPERIHIEDVAHALAFLCRFNGHVRFHYSVAQHSVLVADEVVRRHGPALALTALLHDAPEAFLGDMISPLKAMLPGFKVLEGTLARALARKFGLIYPEPVEVKKADLAVLAAEREQVIAPTDRTAWRPLPPPPPVHIHQLTPDAARELFLARFRDMAQAA